MSSKLRSAFSRAMAFRGDVSPAPCCDWLGFAFGFIVTGVGVGLVGVLTVRVDFPAPEALRWILVVFAAVLAVGIRSLVWRLRPVTGTGAYLLGGSAAAAIMLLALVFLPI